MLKYDSLTHSDLNYNQGKCGSGAW